jgi:hypothetical protein
MSNIGRKSFSGQAVVAIGAKKFELLCGFLETRNTLYFRWFRSLQGSLTEKEGSVQMTFLYQLYFRSSCLLQASLTEEEGSVQLTSLYLRYYIFFCSLQGRLTGKGRLSTVDLLVLTLL